MKNLELIQKLSLEKKLSLIADGNSLAKPEFNGEGIPRVIPASIDWVNSAIGEYYPSFRFLANSWNNKLVSDISADLSIRAKANGVNMLFLPEGKTKSNPYTEGVSEDPFYAGAYLINIAKSVKSAGVTPCVTGCALTPCDVAYLDIKPDARTLHEYIFAPLEPFTGSFGNVLMTSYTKLSGAYERVNTGVAGAIVRSVAGENGYVICSRTDAELAVESVLAGNTFSYASDAGALGSAVANYSSIKLAVGRGEASEDDLNAALRSGAAVGEDVIDGAVDKIIDFAALCNQGAAQESTYNASDLALEGAEESIVLLRNEAALPLARGTRVAVIGQPALAANPASRLNFLQVLENSKAYPVTGAAAGYNLTGEQNDALISEAVSLAKRSDAVLLFLAPELRSEEKLPTTRTLKLPSNRLALISALKDTGTKIIAVLTSYAGADVSFDSSVFALLLADIACARGGEALINILAGKSPSGRLSNTLYADTDEYFETLKKNKDAGKNKVGTFIGYRHYDSSRVAVKYPFGFGLSYTTFSYSNLNVRGDQILVTVKNTGRVAASETVQLYIGKPDSSLIRPVKELKSYIKIFLKAGEAKTLRFRITREKLAVYSKNQGKKLTENGSYDVFVGPNVSDIKLQGKMEVAGCAIPSDNEKYSSYLQSVSNVVDKGYTLAPVQKEGRNGKAIRLAGLITMLAAVCGLAVLGLLDIMKVTSVVYDVGAIVSLVFMCLLFVAGAAVVAVGMAQIKKTQSDFVVPEAERAEAVKAKNEDSLDSLFEEEFEEEKSTEDDLDEPDWDGEAFYADDGTDYPTAAQRLSVYAAERGLNLTAAEARKILAAFSSSRLVLVSGGCPRFSELVKILSGFFGSTPYIENYSHCTTAQELLSLGEGNLLRGIAAAQDDESVVTVCAVQNADAAELSDILLPFSKYFKNPDSGASLTFGNGSGISVSKNLWFVISLSDGSRLKDLGLTLAESASLTEPELTAGREKEVKSEVKTLSFNQLCKMSEMAVKTHSLDEDRSWKKVDKLEKFISSHTSYSIGNRLWRAMERYVSAYLAAGGEDADALDSMTAAKLAAAASVLLDGKLTDADGSLTAAIENIYGEDSVSALKKVLRHSGVSHAAKRSKTDVGE